MKTHPIIKVMLTQSNCFHPFFCSEKLTKLRAFKKLSQPIEISLVDSSYTLSNERFENRFFAKSEYELFPPLSWGGFFFLFTYFSP